MKKKKKKNIFKAILSFVKKTSLKPNNSFPVAAYERSIPDNMPDDITAAVSVMQKLDRLLRVLENVSNKIILNIFNNI